MMIDFLSSTLERIIPLGVVPRVFRRDFSRLRRLRRLGFARARVSLAPAAIPRRPSSPSSRSRHDSTFIIVPSRRALP